MSLADFQNPLANMPLIQHQQQNQSHQIQSTPYYIQEDLDDEVNEELTTVQEADEQAEKEAIRQEDEDRAGKQKKNPRRRAKTPEDETTSEQKPRIFDGVHGRFLDIEA